MTSQACYLWACSVTHKVKNDAFNQVLLSTEKRQVIHACLSDTPIILWLKNIAEGEVKTMFDDLVIVQDGSFKRNLQTCNNTNFLCHILHNINPINCQ